MYLEYCDNNYCKILESAIKFNVLSVVKILTKFTIITNYSKCIDLALEHDHLEIAIYLLEKNLENGLTNYSSVFMSAVHYHNPNMINYLIEHKLDKPIDWTYAKHQVKYVVYEHKYEYMRNDMINYIKNNEPKKIINQNFFTLRIKHNTVIGLGLLVIILEFLILIVCHYR